MKRTLFKGVLDGIVVDRVIRNEEFSMPSIHFHPEYEIYYLLDGEVYYFIENKTYLVKKGNLVIVDSKQIHKTSAYGNTAHERLVIELTSEPFASFFENISGFSMLNFFAANSGILVLDQESQNHVENLLKEIAYEFNNQLPNYQALVMMKITELILFAARCNSGKSTFLKNAMSKKTKHKRIDDITCYIIQNYSKVKSLDEISKHFFINKSYLCRAFKEVTGSTVQDYINIHCIKKAQELLEHSDMRVSEIAATLGYGSVTYFERIFKKYTETTPLKYRKKMHLISQKVRERKKEEELE